jgi:hypothetical protein
MTVLNKSEIPRPVLPKETINIPELGGEVVVCGLILSERLTVARGQGFARMPDMLSRTVVDNEGNPIFSLDEWEIFGISNVAAVFKLFDVAKRLSGLDDDEKKDPAPS